MRTSPGMSRASNERKKMPIIRYMPESDAEFAAWANNFATLLTADPTAYGETGGVASQVQTLNDDYQLALTVATDPSTRTSPTVAAKDVARSVAQSYMRVVAQRIRDNQTVTDEQRLDLGLTVPKTVPTPIPPPSTHPLLGLIAATPLVHRLRYAAADTPTSKAKPFGSIGVEIWVALGTVAATDPAQATYRKTVTKSPFTMSYQAGDVGKVATYFARFVNRSGVDGVAATGPWSSAITVAVVGTGGES